VIATIVTFGLLGLLLATALPALSQPSLSRRDRFGVAFISQVAEGNHYIEQSLSDYAVADLGVGWYSDWRFRADPPQPADATLEYLQMITVRDNRWPPDWDELGNAVSQNIGATWIIGNEPECPNQAALTPEEYARRYHEVAVRILGWDPTAQIAMGGVVLPTPLRMRWLEQTMQSYETQFGATMPIHVWTIHMQILREGPGNAGAGIPVGIDYEPGEPREYDYTDCVNPRVFGSLITSFRAWMAANGQQEKPLIISEMGVLLPSYLLYDDPEMSEAERAEKGDQLIEHFLFASFDWLLNAKDPTIGNPLDDNRLVQRWLWYSLNDSFYDEQNNPRGFNGSLYDYQTLALTRFGEAFIAFQQQQYRLSVPFVKR
jgi:hypothetical protein